MSVATLTSIDYIEVFAASWCYGSAGSSDALRRFERMAEQATAVMNANLQAYCHTYDETYEPGESITASDLKRVVGSIDINRRQRAYNNFESIRYNLVANDGTDFATQEILEALLQTARGFLKREMLRYERNS